MSAWVLVVVLSLGCAANAAQLLFKAESNEGDFKVCPDQQSRCPAESTCCDFGDGRWGCCPFARATCCADNKHCCPQGYSCDMKKGQCAQAINNETIPWAKKELPVSSPVAGNAPPNLLCPDGSSCPAYASCCRTYTGTFRCCAYPNNVCCADGYHCCPRCTVCDMATFNCLPGFATSEWKEIGVSKSSPSLKPIAWAAVEDDDSK